jgi:hypothetical protein
MDWPGRIYSLEQRVKAFARTLADVLARLARAETNIQQSQGGGGFGGGGTLALGVVSTAIPTGTVTSPSTAGRVQIYVGGSSSGSPVQIDNIHTLSASIAVGKAVTIAVIDGSWRVISADC